MCRGIPKKLICISQTGMLSLYQKIHIQTEGSAKNIKQEATLINAHIGNIIVVTFSKPTVLLI